MKNLYGLIAALLIISAIAGFSSYEANTTVTLPTDFFSVNESSKIISGKKSAGQFQPVNIFSYKANGSDNSDASQFVSASSLITLSSAEKDRLLSERPENIIFRIPGNSGTMTELELTQSFPSSPDFKLKEKNGIADREVQYIPGLHYSGIIKGKENSTATISIFKDFVMGMASDENGNYVLGSVKNSGNTFSDNYIFYNDRDMLVTNSFKCGVEDMEEKFIKPVLENSGTGTLNDGGARLPVRIYFEADNKLYTDFNSNGQAVADFVTGMFNSVKTIYQNEGIPIEIGSIGVWTAADPYRTLNDSYDVLLRFGANNQDDFQGNLAHLISSRTAGLGGIAWIRVLCQQYSPQDSAGRFAFSNVEATYSNYPTYSWTINVVTHEMGHNMGSRHTHSCVWPVAGGPIRAIDSCYNAEGGCFTTLRPRVGTIMSYCHLWTAAQGGGVNLSSGFGPLPGDTIRLRYAQARCLDQYMNSSERPSGFELAQNFPNPFNPSTKISFALPKESNVTLRIFDINGKLIADLIDNEFYNAGFFDVIFNTAGYDLSSGVYYYSLSADGNFIGAKQMVLIR